MITGAFMLMAFAYTVSACNPVLEDDRKEPVSFQPARQDNPRTPEIELVQRGVHAMGTVFECTVAAAGNRAPAEAALEAVFEEIRRVEALMTVHRKESPLSKVNAESGDEAVPVPEELLFLIAESKKISELTQGKFDISFGAVGRLWDFTSDRPRLPDPSELKRSLPLVDYRLIDVNFEAHTVRLSQKGMRIGLGAIAKGYAVDRAAQLLKSKGFENFIVYGGGDLLVSGNKGGRPWRVGIQNPRDRARYFAKLELERGGAVVTSGDYEKFFELGGKRYHHIIDPATGYPAAHTVSVTVVSDSAARADAFATGIFVLGPEKGMALIESEPSLEGVIVDSELNTTASSGLKDRIEVEPLKGS
jgi:thiamine biosynthesis lipoprotein